MLVWEIIFLVVVIKIPLVYFGGIIWWSIKSEPELSTEGGGEAERVVGWTRRPPKPGRPLRGTPRGGGLQRGARSARRRERSRVA